MLRISNCINLISKMIFDGESIWTIGEGNISKVNITDGNTPPVTLEGGTDDLD